MRWNDSKSLGPFAYAFDEFDDRLRAVLTGRLEDWPDCSLERLGPSADAVTGAMARAKIEMAKTHLEIFT